MKSLGMIAMRSFNFLLRRALALFRDWRLFVPALLTIGYVVGMLTIQAASPTASVHKGPYAFVGIYKGEIYELIPMEEAVRLRQLARRKEKSMRPVPGKKVSFSPAPAGDGEFLDVLQN